MALGAGDVQRLPALAIGCIDIGTLTAQPARRVESAVGAGMVQWRQMSLVIERMEVDSRS